MFGWLKPKQNAPRLTVCPDPFPRESVVVRQEPSAAASAFRYTNWGGEKFPTGFGPTNVAWPDYWTLRARSGQLYRENLYARGLIRRMVTNEINTGLHLEATPEEIVLGLPQDSLGEWSEVVETRFALWGKRAQLCDHAELRSFGALQAQARIEALVVGDVLVMLAQDQRTKLPRVLLVTGDKVQTPYDRWMDQPGKNRVRHGVELDANGRQVAYHLRQDDGTSKRIVARGPKSGRRLAWLVYGTDRRLDDVRGEPLLALVLQSLREIDRYRDATTRKAVTNAVFAMFVEKESDKLGSFPAPGAAIANDLETTIDSSGNQRSWSSQEQLPGIIINDMQVGEKLKAFPSTGTDEKFGPFEEVLIQAVAWANEIPPEILRLSFSSNYSASQAAINEYKMYLNPVRAVFAQQFCQPIYEEWLLREAMFGKLDAPQLLQAFRARGDYDLYAAWVSTDWAGQIKPAVDMVKLTKAYDAMVASGYMTRSRASRELNGTKFSQNMRILRGENILLAEVNAPLAPLPAVQAAAPAKPAPPDDEDEVNEDGSIDEDEDEPTESEQD